MIKCISLLLFLFGYAFSQIGMNTSYIHDWSTQLVFVDVMRQSRSWLTQNADYNWETDEWDTSIPIPLDSLGYPLEIPYNNGTVPPQVVHTLMTQEINGYYPAGEYTIMYEGTGVISVEFDAEDAIFTEAGTYSVSVNPGDGGIHLTIRESDVNDPVRNIRMIMPGYESVFETEPFYPAFLQRLESFEGIRMLNLQNINITSGNQTQFWSQRKPQDYVTQCPNTGIDSGNIDGMAFEWLIELANTTEKPPWFCIPHKVDDNYVIQLARLLRDNLEPELKIYIEYSNELWNWTYWDQVQYVEEQGLALGLSDDPYLAGLYYQAKRSAEIFQIFENEFEDLSRLVRVISGQAGNPWVAQMLLEGLSEPTINPLGFNADALAIAPYFGGGIADYIGDEGLIESITIDEILDIIEFGIPGHE